MSSAPTAEEISADARWLLQALDPAAGVVRLVAMDRDSYRSASFLDDRLMQRPVDAQILAWPDIQLATTTTMRQDARWIFHIGHVGSTLLSRLLGEIDDVLAIREPRFLRDLAVISAQLRQPYLAPVTRLMSRTFAIEELACVKATSFASEIASELVPVSQRALFIYARPRNYIASILAGENSVRELRTLETFRAQRLAGRSIHPAKARHDADRAAIAWACEMTALQSAADVMSDRQVSWTDFDTALLDLPTELERIASEFGFSLDGAKAAQLAAGPIVTRYSKDPKFEYSPDLRRQLIDQEMRIQGKDIDDALDLIESLARTSPLLDRALSRAEGH